MIVFFPVYDTNSAEFINISLFKLQLIIIRTRIFVRMLSIIYANSYMYVCVYWL